MTECTEQTCEHDHEPVEPFGSSTRWLCSQYGCMWLRCLDQLRSDHMGWKRIRPRRYEPPAKVPDGQLFV